MLASVSHGKRPIKVQDLKSLKPFLLFAWACERTSVKMHSIDSRFCHRTIKYTVFRRLWVHLLARKFDRLGQWRECVWLRVHVSNTHQPIYSQRCFWNTKHPEKERRKRRINWFKWLLFWAVLLGMILGFVTDHFFACFYVISSVRNPCCVGCDSAISIMFGEGGGLRQRGEGETGVILVLKLSVC